MKQGDATLIQTDSTKKNRNDRARKRLRTLLALISRASPKQSCEANQLQTQRK